jgi:hypothetical protein
VEEPFSLSEEMDQVTLLTLGLLAFSLAVFYWFAKFTAKLIRQHYDIYGLLYALEEAEKKDEEEEL